MNPTEAHRIMHAHGNETSARRPAEQEWFKRFPDGGTVYRQPGEERSEVTWVHHRFREAPNGGGTIFKRPDVDESLA